MKQLLDLFDLIIISIIFIIFNLKLELIEFKQSIKEKNTSIIYRKTK